MPDAILASKQHQSKNSLHIHYQSIHVRPSRGLTMAHTAHLSQGP